MTKVNCLLVKKLLSEFYKGKISIKKPNDLLINNKKISGISTRDYCLNQVKNLLLLE